MRDKVVKLENLSLGDTVYYVRSTHNWLPNWYRYDKPNYTFEVITLTFTGVVETKIIGEVSDNYENSIDYLFQDANKNFFELDPEELFFTLPQAEEYKNKIIAEDKL
jgi:hypothetical protein